MGDLYALIKPKGSTQVLLVSIDQPVQEQLGIMFGIYADQFSDGIDEAIGFEIGYNPDDNQVVEMDFTAEMQAIAEQIDAGPIGRDVYDPETTAPTEMRALLWSEVYAGYRRILVQNFTGGQALSQKFGLIFTGETFRRITEPSLLISSKIDAVLSDGRISYKKFNVIKQVFDLTELYREATDQDIARFFDQLPFTTNNVESFCQSAKITSRKLIFSISRSGIIDNIPVQDIQARAAALDIQLELNNGQIILEEGHAAIQTLKFLDNSIYRSPVNDERWMANSRRRI